VAYFDYDRNDHKTELEVLDFERRAVKKSDVMLVNLRNIEKSVGTICELAWAFEYDIPIVAFYESEDEYELQLHPWIENMCDRIECGVGAMEKALRYVRDYYSVF
jgi:nucleoside 2-deoxyribosyltransferase